MIRDEELLAEFPILSFVEDNRFSEPTLEMLKSFCYDEKQHMEIQKNWNLFQNQKLQISWLSCDLEDYLLDSTNFCERKQLLKSSPQECGILLLDKHLLPNFADIPDYITDANPDEHPLNMIMYSWLESNEHDKLLNQFDEEDSIIDPGSRNLLFLPFFGNEFTIATDSYQTWSHEDEYCTEHAGNEGRGWYGNIMDFIMTYIIFYNYYDEPSDSLPGTNDLFHSRETSLALKRNKIEWMKTEGNRRYE